ncbi:hypothetical protein VTK73DRAFT_10297 [Phialemonium thermophilum]|uniref:Uncharacterized protein n=1 Tax=Phialemonium thermophilum TaxID=223376 RepID=A0ABR3VXD6_9PEZI
MESSEVSSHISSRRVRAEVRLLHVDRVPIPERPYEVNCGPGSNFGSTLRRSSSFRGMRTPSPVLPCHHHTCIRGRA